MASLNSYLPSDGSAVWRRDTKSELATGSQTVRHVVIRGTEVVSQPSPHVVYRIDVLTEHAHWYICRRYSEFHDLHRTLVRRCKISKELLPPKKLSGNLSHQLIKQRKEQLEQFLQKLINSETHISQAQELLDFLDVLSHDVTRVAKLLAHQLYAIGDKLLEDGTPIALTINDLHCITKRLRLPMDTHPSADPAADLGHLYSFLHQIVSLKVIPPPPPSSVTRMAFEITHFKSLEILKIECVPLSQVSGLARVQQQLKKLSIHYTLKSLRELLIDSVEERRTGGESKPLTDSWRLVATAKFTSNRVVIQPWNSLVILNISHNKITCLDDYLQVLPALKEFNASHNLIVHLDLHHLCLPYLTHVNLSHNHITTVNSRRLVIESMENFNMSDNGLFDLSFLSAFVGLTTLNLTANRVSSKKELDYISHLKALQAVHLKGNPIMVSGAARIVLMAKFIQCSKTVSIDGSVPTTGELNRIRQHSKRHGTNVDNWPVAQSLKAQTTPTRSREDTPSQVPPSPPSVHVSWTVESLNKPYRSNDSSPTHSYTSSTYSEGSFDNPLFSDSPVVNSGHPHKNPAHLVPRDDPDGQSEASVDPSDSSMSVPSPLVLPTPPCTPMSTGDHTTCSNVTPQMISAALEALSVSLSSTPNEDRELPDILSQALNNFISGSSSKCATPPSTPQDHDDYPMHSISAGDLISAITSTLSAHCDLNRSNESLPMSRGGPPSVPFGTPMEGGGLSELSKLGIQPESLLGALNKIRSSKDNEFFEVYQQTGDEEEGEESDGVVFNVTSELDVNEVETVSVESGNEVEIASVDGRNEVETVSVDGRNEVETVSVDGRNEVETVEGENDVDTSIPDEPLSANSKIEPDVKDTDKVTEEATVNIVEVKDSVDLQIGSKEDVTTQSLQNDEDSVARVDAATSLMVEHCKVEVHTLTSGSDGSSSSTSSDESLSEKGSERDESSSHDIPAPPTKSQSSDSDSSNVCVAGVNSSGSSPVTIKNRITD